MSPAENKDIYRRLIAEVLNGQDRLCRKVYDLYHILKSSSEKNTTNCG